MSNKFSNFSKSIWSCINIAAVMVITSAVYSADFALAAPETETELTPHNNLGPLSERIIGDWYKACDPDSNELKSNISVQLKIRQNGTYEILETTYRDECSRVEEISIQEGKYVLDGDILIRTPQVIRMIPYSLETVHLVEDQLSELGCPKLTVMIGAFVDTAGLACDLLPIIGSTKATIDINISKDAIILIEGDNDFISINPA